MNKKKEILYKIQIQKKEYYNWIYQLNNYLLNNLNKEIDVFIINYEWIYKYITTFFFKDKCIEDLSNLYIIFENINNDNLIFLKNLDELPKIFILNENTWNSLVRNNKKELEFKVKAQLGNKILFFKNNNYTYYFYCLFFLDKNNKIRQSYIKINKEEKENEIIKDIKVNGILKFLKHNNINLSKEKLILHLNDFDIIISEYLKTNKNNINEKTMIIKHKLSLTNKFKNIKNNPFSNYIKNQNNNNINKNTNNNFNNNTKINLFNNNNNKNINNNSDDNNINKNIKNNINKDINNKINNNINNKINNSIKNNINKNIYNNITNIYINNNNINIHINNYKNPLNQISNNNQKIKSNVEINDENLLSFRPKKIIVKNNKKSLSPKKSFRKKKNFDFNLEEFLPNKLVHKELIPGIIGLKTVNNIKETHYLNSIVQCLSNIIRFRNELLNEDKFQHLENNKNTISFAIAQILHNLWKNVKHQFFNPEYFQNMVTQLSIALNNKKNLILFILERMHYELNKNININNYIFINNNNFNSCFNDFIKKYNSQNNSIISNEFQGCINTSIICSNCKNYSNLIEIFQILFFPLKQVKYFMKYKINSIRINHCFEFNEKEDIIPLFHCNNCNQNIQAFKSKKILYAPKTLILYFNRHDIIGPNINVIFEEYLNISKYVAINNNIFMYELVGVISQEGFFDKGEHFIAYCKYSENCEWYKYNDQNVYKTTFNEIREKCIPYALFYSYIQR